MDFYLDLDLEVLHVLRGLRRMERAINFRGGQQSSITIVIRERIWRIRIRDWGLNNSLLR